jgi:phosphoenolpyruvate synthase/pyruvate phosphate dikinase
MKFNNLYEAIQPYLDEIKNNSNNIECLRRNAYNIRALIKNGEFPNDIYDQIVSNYIILSRKYTTVSSAMEDVTDVAVRSSSTIGST